MQYEWDPAKNESNIADHGFDFADAPLFFDQPYFEDLDTREHYGEDRYVAIGRIYGTTVVLVYTSRGDDTRRIISLRRANKGERIAYEQEIANRLGTPKKRS